MVERHRDVRQLPSHRRRRRGWTVAASFVVLSALTAVRQHVDAFTPRADSVAPERRRQRPIPTDVGLVSATLDSPTRPATAVVGTRADRQRLHRRQRPQRIQRSTSNGTPKQKPVGPPRVGTEHESVVPFRAGSAVAAPSASSSFAATTTATATPVAAVAVRTTPKRKRKPKMVRPKGLVSGRKIDRPPASDPNLNAKDRRKQLLTQDEENQLSDSVQALRYVNKVKDELTAMVPSSNLSEKIWADACDLTVVQLRRTLYEGQEARSTLVSANAGLVVSLAKRYHRGLRQAMEAGGGVGTILSLQDMIQEGNMGLMRAAERYDPGRGLRFSTYATYWIRQKILRSISDHSRTIRLPVHVHAALSKINRARQAMADEIGRVPSDPELAHYMEMDVNKLRRYTGAARNVVSLENPVRSGGSFKDDTRTIGETIASDAPTPEEDALRQYLKDDIKIVIDTLPEPERMVLILRFGLESGDSLTIDQTAKKLGMTRDQVRMTEARALNKLRNPQRNYRLKDYVGVEAEEEETKIQSPFQMPGSSMSHDNLWFF